MQPWGSSPPGNLITKHEDDTRKRKREKKKQHDRPPFCNLSQSMEPSLLSAMQLHTTCWVLSWECGQQVTGELMKCQDGGREIACITYPQGALVVFPRLSHTGREDGRSGHTVKYKVVLPSTPELLFSVQLWKWEQSPSRFLNVKGTTTICKGQRHEES